VSGQGIGNIVCSGIEVVITGLTRNQFGSNPTRVRIPPAAPEMEVKNDIWLKKPVFASLPRLPNVKIREP
jgi:hypothetical protein